MDNQLICLKVGLKPETVNIDPENRKLNGIVAIEPIDIKDYRPFSINQEFISDLVSAANKQKEGVKSHFGHNWSNEGMLLGRATNWRVEDDKAKYDLTIYKSSDKSPKMPGMGSYLLDLMTEDNNAMMNSIVFREQYFYQETKDGQKIKCYYYDKESGSWIAPNKELGKVYPKLGQLYSTDIVSEGAATNSMFSTMPMPQEGKLQKFFNTIKEFFTLAEDESGFTSPINSEHMDTNPTPAAAPAAEESAEMKALRADLAAANQKLAALAPTPAPEPEESAEMKELRAQLAEANKKLAAAPAANPVALQADGGGDSTTQPWLLDPDNQEFIALYNQQKSK